MFALNEMKIIYYRYIMICVVQNLRNYCNTNYFNNCTALTHMRTNPRGYDRDRKETTVERKLYWSLIIATYVRITTLTCFCFEDYRIWGTYIVFSSFYACTWFHIHTYVPCKPYPFVALWSFYLLWSPRYITIFHTLGVYSVYTTLCGLCMV